MLKKIKENLIYSDKWLSFFQDEIEFDDGSKGTYAWVNRKNGVGVVVMTTDKKILLHKEYRYVIKDYSWEVQGGGIDENETPAQAVVRELKEEAGIEVAIEALKKLGEFYPLHSFNTEKVTIFLVVIDQPTLSSAQTEISEEISERKFVSFEEALAMIDSGLVNDAFTAHAIQMAIRKCA